MSISTVTGMAVNTRQRSVLLDGIPGNASLVGLAYGKCIIGYVARFNVTYNAAMCLLLTHQLLYVLAICPVLSHINGSRWRD